MADFTTHLIGASLVSGTVATLFSVPIGYSSTEATGYFALGVIGGLLPDIDSETSIPVRLAQRIVTTLGTLFTVLWFVDRYSLTEIAIIAVVTFAMLTAFFTGFAEITVHRGLVHSIPATACFGFATAIIAQRGFGLPPEQCWFSAAFLMLGVVTHLVLDELYSVNLLGVKLKKSFGSALSLGDRNNLLGTSALYAAAVVLFMLTPSNETFLSAMTDPDTYAEVVTQVWPDDGNWFERK